MGKTPSKPPFGETCFVYFFVPTHVIMQIKDFHRLLVSLTCFLFVGFLRGGVQGEGVTGEP